MVARSAYEIVVPPELMPAWNVLSKRDHARLSARLLEAAQAAWTKPATWPEGPPGIHRGRHRAVVDDLWLLYRLNDESKTVNLIAFGSLDT